MQEESPNSKGASFKRLRRFQVSEGLTWVEVAEKLGISVSMVMMVKRGKRNLSEKALYRLEQAEREATEQRSRAERVVNGLLAEEGAARELLERESQKLTNLDFKVEYCSARITRSLPEKITLWRPTGEICTKLRQLFAETLDTPVILLACLPETFRSESFLAQLTPDSRIRLTNGALTLVIPNWRSLVAGKAVATTKETK